MSISYQKIYLRKHKPIQAILTQYCFNTRRINSIKKEACPKKIHLRKHYAGNPFCV